ncbi:MAG TPA: TraB/GumN family protein [Candidatus Nanoarchaeia archaeon]|nr:TraB/GumN family protein [Candidatus Nanoarchaeia archaeon]
MIYRNLHLLGTSHIAKESVQAVEREIAAIRPAAIALELDPGRLAGLLGKRQRMRMRDVFHVGIKGFLFALIGAWAERKLGKVVGISPGAEMLAAVQLAREQQIPLHLIDQDIAVTLRKISREFSWRERWRLFVDIVLAPFRGKSMLQKYQIDLRKVPAEQAIVRLLADVKSRYPNLYRVLITERNAVMAHRLSRLMSQHPQQGILGIVGAGHVTDIITRIQAMHKI